MSYALWYSVQKNLPDAKFHLASKRGGTAVFFDWARRLKINYCQYENIDEVDINNKLVFKSPAFMAVREYNPEDISPKSVKTSEICTFVDYNNGCGRFNANAWQRKEAPFPSAVQRFNSGSMTQNEFLVLKMWERSYPFFMAVLGAM